MLPAAAANSSYVTVAAIYWDGSTLRDWKAVVPSSLAGSVTEDLSEIPSVLAAGTVGRRGILETPPSVANGKDTRRSEQWALDRLDYGKYSADGSGVVVAVIDTGVDATHPDLAGRVLPGYDVYDATSLGKIDPNGHGTHVAGIIAAAAGNGSGISGLAPAVKILPVRVLDETGYGDDSLVAKGVLWAVLNGAQVINLSLGGPDRDPLLADAIDKAVAAGVAVVVAAGNDGLSGSPVSYPGAHPSVTAVAATSTNDQRALFSTVGPYVDVAAPGMSILSTWPSASYSYQSGTSMATPYVSAATALVISGLQLAPRVALARIVSSATDVDTTGVDPSTGAGLIDPFAALGDGKPRTIEARGKIAAPSLPNMPELALPRLELPLLAPLPTPTLPPLPAMTLPKLELPKLTIPLQPSPVLPFPVPAIPSNPATPVKPIVPVTPGRPSSPTPAPTKSPTEKVTSPLQPRPVPVKKPSSGYPVTLTLKVTTSERSSLIRIGLRNDSGPLARRSLVVVSGGKKWSVVTDALGFAQFRSSSATGTVRFAGDRVYAATSRTWRAR